MIFGFMVDIFNEADPTPDISIGENDGNGGGGSGGNGSGGSGGSSGTVDPDIPDDPETPDEPDVPDDPVQPGEPEDPDEPVNPDPEPDPETPIDPTPDVPDEPDEPDVPDEPDEPINPDPEPDPEPEVHEHTITSWYIDPAPTCESSGLKWGVCTVCGHREETSVNALGHSYGNDDVCDRCGHISAEHVCVWGEYTIVTPATCTSEGVKSAKCTSCTKTNEVSIPKTAHDYGDWEITKSATCTEAGSQRRECQNCNDEQIQNVNALGHTYRNDGVCERCGHISAEHVCKWGEYTIVTPATCTSEGVKRAKCTSCTKTNEVSIPKTAHEYGDWSTTKDETCTETGSESRACENCSDTQTQSIPALGHDWSGWQEVAAPGCETLGLERRYCKRCNASEEQSIEPLDHNYVDYICTRCGHVTNHTCQLGDWVYAPDATCTEYGYRHKYCTICSEVKKTETLYPKGHTFGDDNVCDICGYEQCEHEVEEWFVEQEATCFEDGISSGMCIHCGEIIYKYPECKGHSFNSDDICEDCHYRKPSDEYENDMEDNSSWVSGTTDDGVNYTLYDIDMSYLNNGKPVYLGVCIVDKLGNYVPIEFTIKSEICRRVRIEVSLSHPVGESVLLTRYSDGVTISPIEYGDYGAAFEFDYDYYDCFIFDLTFSTAEYPDAHVQELYIYCYEG